MADRKDLQEAERRIEEARNKDSAELNLGELRLRELPASLKGLKSLKALFLFNNSLIELPDWLSDFRELLLFDLGSNQLTRLPDWIGHLSKLEYLAINGNELHELPEWIGQLKRLQTLHLQFSEIRGLPKSFAELTGLRSLYLGYNHLIEVPDCVRSLTALHSLYLNNNQLVDLPHWIGELRQLAELNVSDNRLTSLPVSIRLIKTLRRLWAEGNPITVPPAEIVGLGARAVSRYMREVVRAGQTLTRYEAKLVFVGWGEVGKSCLVANLRGDDPRELKGATQGVEVRELPEFAHPNQAKHSGARIRLVAWDFGGQEIDHATHRFFLTRRSLYLVLWKPREATEEEHVHDWLRSIALYCPGARVLLVATHADAEPPNPSRLDFEAVRREYGSVGDEPARLTICDRLHHIDNLTQSGINDLWETIQRESEYISGLEDQWLPTWISAEKKLEDDERHEISHEELLAICKYERIDKETVRAFLAGWWHELGKLLHFPDDPYLCQRVVLKPNWITKAISRVMRNKKVEMEGGILDERDLDGIWNVKDEQGFGPFGEEYHEPFLRLMHRFGLSYELKREHGLSARQFLIPYLLPTIPSVHALSPPEAPEGRPQLLYRFGLLPPGLMSRLIVALHRNIHRDAHWRSGVVLEDAGNFVRMETYSDAGQTVLRLTGWGQYHSYGFFSRVRGTLDTLLEDYKGREVRIEVPCPTPGCKNTFSWRRLDGRWRAIRDGKLESGQENEFCEMCGETHTIAHILYGIHPSSSTLMAERIEALVASQLKAHREETALTLREIGRQMQWDFRALWDRMGGQCPSLFRLLPSTASDLAPKEQIGTTYRLHLCCQWQEGVHDCDPPYDVFEADGWVRGLATLAGRAASIIALMRGHVSGYEDLRGTFVDDAQKLQGFVGSGDPVARVAGRHLESASGERIALDEAAVGAFHDWLVKQPGLRFRGLQQYSSPRDGVIWLCPKHRAEAVQRWGEYGEGPVGQVATPKHHEALSCPTNLD